MGIVFPVVAIAFSHAAGDTTNEWAAPDFSEPPISRKMTFAKLYKPYDWVVATGVYMDDVEAMIKKETMIMSKNYDQQIINFGFLLMIIVIYMIFLLSLSFFYLLPTKRTIPYSHTYFLFLFSDSS